MKIAKMEVSLLDKMGSDLTVANAARVSFNKQSVWEDTTERGFLVDRKLSDRDTKLIHYLAAHNHWTPFGHCFAQFWIKAPIFVARQLVKHQVGLVWNEVSRRYVDSEPEFWFPKVWRGRPEGSMKQGSSGEVDGIEVGTDYIPVTTAVKNFGLLQVTAMYKQLIEGGIAPEQARMILPQNTMTEWYWSGSLAAFARVCKLRLDPHAQQETAEVAELISKYMSELFPVSWRVLTKKESV